MPEATKITDPELLEKIKNSIIDDADKTELEKQLTNMTAEEKEKLSDILDGKMLKDDPEYQASIKKLNAETTEKMEALVKEESTKARVEMEKKDKEESTEELKKMEIEINDTSTENQNSVGIQNFESATEQPATTKKSKKYLLYIAILILIATGILYTLTTL